MMFLTPETIENVAWIIAEGIIAAACIVAAGLVLAKVVEVLGIRRVFSRRGRDARRHSDCSDRTRPPDRRNGSGT